LHLQNLFEVIKSTHSSKPLSFCYSHRVYSIREETTTTEK